MIVLAKNVSKSFGDFIAVDNVNFEINKGECFGLLGPNGAGKSTLISLIYGAAGRDSGELTVLGMDPANDSRQIKKSLGVVTQENALDEELNVLENMELFASFLKIPKKERKDLITKLLEFMQISHKATSPIKTLSGGMQRRLVFVRALLSNPEFLILDEPTTGLDPAVRHLIWNKIRELKSNQSTILLTTHYMDEAERLCDRIVIMDSGEIKAHGTPKDLISSICPGYVAHFLKIETTTDQMNSVTNKHNHLVLAEDERDYSLRGPDLNELTEIIRDTKLSPEMIRPSNLEDVFLNVTGRKLSEDA